MKSFEIQLWLLRALQVNSADILIPNYYFGMYEADIFRVNKQGYTIEYEIKISKADFRKDFTKSHRVFVKNEQGEIEKEEYTDKRGNKYKRWKTINVTKHQHIQEGNRTNKFYFCCPEGLIDKSEIPKEYGLIYFTPGEYLRWRIVKQAKFLHKNKATETIYRDCAQNLSTRRLSMQVDNLRLKRVKQ